MYPVTQMYVGDESNEDIVDCVIRSIIKVNMTEPEGDVLCFWQGRKKLTTV